METKKTITVRNAKISIIKKGEWDFISLTDMVKSFEQGNILIDNWLRNRNTVEFIGIWEQINNLNFNSPEFELIKAKSGLNSFTLSVKKWTELTKAQGIFAKAGRYSGGTYAHKDIAFEFGSWLSPEFKLYLIKEFQRLKKEESSDRSIDWTVQRTLAKVNYRLHTDAVKEHLLPPKISRKRATIIYATEADILNLSLFGITAKEWKKNNSEKKGNIRDYATVEQLIVLSNLESLNSVLLHQRLSQEERIILLNNTAITQMKSILKMKDSKIISEPETAYLAA